MPGVCLNSHSHVLCFAVWRALLVLSCGNFLLPSKCCCGYAWSQMPICNWKLMSSEAADEAGRVIVFLFLFFSICMVFFPVWLRECVFGSQKKQMKSWLQCCLFLGGCYLCSGGFSCSGSFLEVAFNLSMLFKLVVGSNRGKNIDVWRDAQGDS